MPAETLGRNRTRSEPAQAGVPAVAVPRVTGWHAFVLTMGSQPIQGGFHHCDARDCLNSKPCINEKRLTHLSPAECSNYAFGDGSQFRNRSGVRPEEARRAGSAELLPAWCSVRHTVSRGVCSRLCSPANISNVVRCLVSVFLIIGLRLDNVGSCLIGIVAMISIVADVSY
jgi:hypothetical protein